MERNRRKKLIIIFVLFACVASLSIGFAAFSSTLNISSSASVSPNSDTFSVKFSTSQDSLDDSDVVPSSKTDGITASNAVINNTFNPMISNLNAIFTSPGQYVEYTFYARNEGEYTAYLNSVNFIGNKSCEKIGEASTDLVNSACDSINISVDVSGNTYLETTEISGHALSKKSGEQIKVRLEYDEDGTAVDGEIKIIFNEIMLVYSTIDDSSFMPPENGDEENINSNNMLYSKIKFLYSMSDENINFDSTEIETGVYLNYATKDFDNPIYYYRGAITDNNLLFANYCWKIVRTTETGGVKLIYNGVPDSDNKCVDLIPLVDMLIFNADYGIDNAKYIISEGVDSAIKAVIDQWYEENLLDYSEGIEDTEWCNDRGELINDGDEVIFNSSDSVGVYDGVANPSMFCDEQYKLSVSAASGDNKLKYPIALLTADELTFAGLGYRGYSSDNFLICDDIWWTLTPIYYVRGEIHMFHGSSVLQYDVGSRDFGVRPSISLKPGTLISGGNGSSDTPYIIN